LSVDLEMMLISLAPFIEPQPKEAVARDEATCKAGSEAAAFAHLALPRLASLYNVACASRTGKLSFALLFSAFSTRPRID
jgi:hypothetical protein